MKRLAYALLLLLLMPSLALAADDDEGRCTPWTMADFCGPCMLPFTIGGAKVRTNTTEYDVPETHRSPVCSCLNPATGRRRPGVTVGFWENARAVGINKTPGKFSLMCANVLSEEEGQKRGGMLTEGGATTSFRQANIMVTPWMATMGVLQDVTCVEGGEFDVAYMTEVDPTWSNEVLAQFLAPESILFAGIATVATATGAAAVGEAVISLPCIADAASLAVTRQGLGPLRFCNGTYGLFYPLGGYSSNAKVSGVGMADVGRFAFKLARQLMTSDLHTNLCQPTAMPMLNKALFAVQPVRPTRKQKKYAFGTSEVLLGSSLSPSQGTNLSGPDDLLFNEYRKRACCML